jgi:hypothetical protein
MTVYGWITMLREANRFCLRLWKDESGVVLAVTVVTFLTLFVIATSVFVVGETIRQRIEVQNAADAAAYGAAVVQADALARIATINKAMGWTYAQQVKMNMDYIVDKWLILSVLEWLKDFIKVRLLSMVSTCTMGPFTGADDWYTGQNHLMNRKSMKLNKGPWVDVEDIIAAHKSAGQSTFLKLLPKIIKASINIKMMNKAEVKIIKKMEKQMEKATKKLVKENIKTERNDKLSKHRRGDIRWAFLNNPENCFTVCKGEHMFMRMVFGRGFDEVAYFGPGADDWFVKGPAISRHYEQKGNVLVAEWNYRGATWLGISPACGPTITSMGSTESKAGDYEDGLYKTAEPEPQMLDHKYFEKDGAIIVGVARRLNNPFQFLFPHRKITGIFSLFSSPTGEGDANHYIWGVAAARAGYRDESRPNNEGSYNTTVDSYEQEYDPVVDPSEVVQWWQMNHGWAGLSPHNLSTTDWDACLIPLHRAWSGRKPGWQNRGPAAGTGGTPTVGRWEKETAHRILNELWTSTEWQNLDKRKEKGPLRTFADGGGPRGMTGDISYGGQMEDHVYH